MRLACPECDAQYEVEDAAIPDGGREVQCSACGHNWFQFAQLAVTHDAPLALKALPPVSVTPAPPEATARPASAAEAAPPAETARARPPADFREVLRQEAEREAAARRREGVAPPPAPASRDRGFMTGMLLALVPLGLLAGAYAGAPQLMREAPALSGPLMEYVARVDALRLTVDGWLQRVADAR